MPRRPERRPTRFSAIYESGYLMLRPLRTPTRTLGASYTRACDHDGCGAPRGAGDPERRQDREESVREGCQEEARSRGPGARRGGAGGAHRQGLRHRQGEVPARAGAVRGLGREACGPAEAREAGRRRGRRGPGQGRQGCQARGGGGQGGAFASARIGGPPRGEGQGQPRRSAQLRRELRRQAHGALTEHWFEVAHAVPARAERVPAHRPRQSHALRFRHRQEARRRDVPALRRHQPRGGEAGVHRQHPVLCEVARARAREGDVLLGLLRHPARARGGAHQAREGVRVPPDQGGNRGEPPAPAGVPAHLRARGFTKKRDAAPRGRGESVPRALGGDEPFAVRKDDGGRVRGGRVLAPHEGRLAQRHHVDVGPGGVPREVRDAPALGGQVLRVPHVRLHALPGGLAGERDALAVHAGV